MRSATIFIFCSRLMYIHQLRNALKNCLTITRLGDLMSNTARLLTQTMIQTCKCLKPLKNWAQILFKYVFSVTFSPRQTVEQEATNQEMKVTVKVAERSSTRIALRQSRLMTAARGKTAKKISPSTTKSIEPDLLAAYNASSLEEYNVLMSKKKFRPFSNLA